MSAQMQDIAQPKKPKSTLMQELKSLSWAVLAAILIRTFLFQPFIIPSGSMKPGLLIGDFIFVSKYTYGFTQYSLPFNLPLIPGRIFGDRKPKQGEVIVFRGTTIPDKDYIKRVIGVPGDRVQMRDGILYINDVEAPVTPDGNWVDDLWVKRTSGGGEEYMRGSSQERVLKRYIETLPNELRHTIVKAKPYGEAVFDNTPVFTVPEGHYFVMGDNRDESGDSRAMGLSHREAEVGFVPEEKIIGKAQIIWLSINARPWHIWEWITGIRFDRFFKKID